MKDSTYLLNSRIESLLKVVNSQARRIDYLERQLDAQFLAIKGLNNNHNLLREAIDQLCDESE